MNQRVLLMSAPFGSGHLSAAKAVAQACRELSPTDSVEISQCVSRVLKVASAGYLTLLDWAPDIYRRLYRAPSGESADRMIQLALGPTVRREVRRQKPTVLVATHPFVGAAAADLSRIGKLAIPIAMVVTDFDPHPIWVHEQVDRYFVPTAAASQKLRTLGVDESRIRITGIPIGAGFTSCQSGRIARAGRRVLVMGGGLGLGPIVEVMRSLAKQPSRELAVTVVCGSNRQLERSMMDLFGADLRITILGYTERVPELMAEADLLITKPGGVSCSEALASSLPMLLLPPLPGQEEDNATYLTQSGAAMAVDPSVSGEIVSELLFRSSERLGRMQAAAGAVGRPRAAEEIAREIALIAEQYHRSAAEFDLVG